MKSNQILNIFWSQPAGFADGQDMEWRRRCERRVRVLARAVGRMELLLMRQECLPGVGFFVFKFEKPMWVPRGDVEGSIGYVMWILGKIWTNIKMFIIYHSTVLLIIFLTSDHTWHLTNVCSCWSYVCLCICTVDPWTAPVSTVLVHLYVSFFQYVCTTVCGWLNLWMQNLEYGGPVVVIHEFYLHRVSMPLTLSSSSVNCNI